jgi:hypothetical protein
MEKVILNVLKAGKKGYIISSVPMKKLRKTSLSQNRSWTLETEGDFLFLVLEGDI